MIGRGKFQLALAASAILLVWLVVLPWLGRRGELRRAIDRNEAAGIDPSALFYTDLEHLEYADGGLKRSAEHQQR